MNHTFRAAQHTMPHDAMPFANAPCQRSHRERGVVLPMALIMLVIISLAGLLAARNSATHEQFSNNMRTTQVARQSAEAALRYCEQVVIDIISDEGAVYGALQPRIVTTELAPVDIETGAWNTKANWVAGAASLITYTPEFGATVKEEAQVREENYPTCIIQVMTEDRFLITSRGLSNDAVIEDDELVRGSEIWLQSVLSPSVPVASATGGNQ